MNKNKTSWVPIAACMVLQLCISMVYLWSALTGPVTAAYSAGLEEAATARLASAAALVPSIMLLALVCGSLASQLLRNRIGLKFTSMAGMVLYALGIALSGLVKSILPLILTYGILAGLGAGIAYGASCTCIRKCLPLSRGFASGVAAAALSLAAVIVAPVVHLLVKGHMNADGIANLRPVFLILAVIFLVLGLGASWLIALPDEAHRPHTAHTRSTYASNASLQQLIHIPAFRCLFFTLFCLGSAWNLCVPLIQSLGTARGLTSGMAFACLILTGIFCAAGRVAMGWLSDQLGRFPVLYMLCGVNLVCSLLLTFIGGYGYFITVPLLAFAYGGFLSICGALCTDLFGEKHPERNFSAALLALGLSAVCVTLLSRYLFRANMVLTFLLAAVTAVVPVILLLRLSRYQAVQKARRK